MANFPSTFVPPDPSALEAFLKYGVAGLAAILAILAFSLLAYGIYRNSLRVISVVAIVGFMVFSCVLVVLTQIPPEKLVKLLIRDQYVIVDGKILEPPDPASVNVSAVRTWRLGPPDVDGTLRLPIYENAAEIRLLFSTQDYGQVVPIRDDKIKDGSYSLGDIRLKKGLDTHRW